MSFNLFGDSMKLSTLVILQLITGQTYIQVKIIVGDPGAFSRVGRKGATKVFMYGRKSPWVPTLTKLFPKI